MRGSPRRPLRTPLLVLGLLGLFGLFGGLAGCGLLGERPVRVRHASGETVTGVRWVDLAGGTGATAGPRSRVTIHYRARVLGGAPVDSTYDRGRPETFDLPHAPVLAWADAIPGMRAGGRRRLVAPPERAFGDAGIEGLVPPRATLEFEVELLEVAPAGAAGAAAAGGS